LEALQKLIIGLIKNAVEYTPDGGKIEVSVKNKKAGVEFTVHDVGVGIEQGLLKHIFEGFFPTHDTMAYSSKKPFDFNAGGKGADLLRLKIFSERFNFQLSMLSTRCQHIPHQSDVCPGKISHCDFCRRIEDCHQSGETIVRAIFPCAEKGSTYQKLLVCR
jgi:hypothetical protein